MFLPTRWIRATADGVDASHWSSSSTAEPPHRFGVRSRRPDYPAGVAVTAVGSEVPTRADAVAAAEALVAAGAEEVLLFGSVARGDADRDSDIDLVALFADIDYAQRHDLKKRLEAVAGAVVDDGWPVQVVVTDRPEWRARVRNVSASFEQRISAEAVAVATSATRGPVRWDKEMVRPMSNPAEALQQFNDRALNRVTELRASMTRQFDEDASWLTPEQRESVRLQRVVRVCEDSAMLVELSLKALAVLHGVGGRTGRNKELRSAGHDIAKCLDLLPEPRRAAVEATVRSRDLPLRTMSHWRIVATYVDDVPAERAEADRLVDDHVSTALAVCGHLVAELQGALGDTIAMREASTLWEHSAAYIANQDARTGRPRNSAEGREA